MDELTNFIREASENDFEMSNDGSILSDSLNDVNRNISNLVQTNGI